jgi:plastocyanin
MRFSLAVAALSSVVAVSAVTIPVSVGFNNQLVFNPANISAQVGDVVAFTFLNKNHSVTQSTFADPCSIMTTPAQGIDSGFQPVAANAAMLPQWSFTVNNASAPLWFYCAQTNPANHCHAGMVFSVNANENSPKSFEAYQAAAMSGNAAAAPPSGGSGSAIAGATSAIGSAVAGATGVIGSAVAGATGAVGSAVAGATGVIGSAAGALPSDGSNALSAGAAAVTGLFGSGPAASALPSGSGAGNSTGNGNGSGRVGASAVSLFAVVGLAAGMLL